MADQHDHPRGVPFAAESEQDQRLWQDLGNLEPESPPASLRRRFYHRLREAETRPFGARVAGMLRWAAPAAATLLLGVVIGLQLPRSAAPSDLEALDAEVSALNQTVALMLMQNPSASDRLRGVTLASRLEGANGHLTAALLATAARDPVAGVRNAAVEALGPHMSDPEVGPEIERLLLDTRSVLVQTALAELVMRWGDENQIMRLVEAAESDRLNPEVGRYVLERVRRISA